MNRHPFLQLSTTAGATSRVPKNLYFSLLVSIFLYFSLLYYTLFYRIPSLSIPFITAGGSPHTLDRRLVAARGVWTAGGSTINPNLCLGRSARKPRPRIR